MLNLYDSINKSLILVLMTNSLNSIWQILEK